MELRDIVRHGGALVRMRTKLKNKVHSMTLMKDMDISSLVLTCLPKEISIS